MIEFSLTDYQTNIIFKLNLKTKRLDNKICKKLLKIYLNLNSVSKRINHCKYNKPEKKKSAFRFFFLTFKLSTWNFVMCI